MNIENRVDPKIINLSSRDLSTDEISLLQKGLKFTPTPSANQNELKNDVQEFGRKLRLLDYFHEQQQNTADNSIARNKSNFVPPKTQDKYLETFLDALSEYPENMHTTTSKNRSNLTKGEKTALNDLMNDDSIIIKEADKGGATVIMDKTFYKDKIEELLSDTENYTKVENGNQDESVIKKIKKHLDKFQPETTKSEKEYIHKFTWKTSNFYGLPKIHKCEQITRAVAEHKREYIKLSAPENLKFRPIVAGPLSPTHRLSNFIDIILKPLCQHVPSFIRDDIDFLNYLPQEVVPQTLLVSFDVVSLYTSIPHELGLTAVEYWLDNHTNSLPRQFSKEFILESISLILKENTFNFNDNHYRQLQGTAMGTKMAPTYATLVMGYLEQILYEKYKEKFGNDDIEELINGFKRFLDDCFILWKRSTEELIIFHQILNSLHTKIKFTMETDDKELPFLDVLVYKQGNKIYTDIFYKGTDTHQYLNYRSCHPKHTKHNIPYSLARRVCSIVSKEEIRDKRLKELEKFLSAQNYPTKLIEQGIKKAKSFTTAELRQSKHYPKQSTNILPLIITHNPRNPQITNKIRKDLEFLNNSQKMKAIMDKTTLIVSKRQPKNLKKYLTRAEFSSNMSRGKGVSKCLTPRCGTCDIIIPGNKITLTNGKCWEIKTDMTCKAKNVIYIIICTKCNEFYIGQTEHLRNRVTLHREQIRHEQYRHLKVSEHLAKCSDGNFKIMPIYKCENTTKLFRESKEQEIMKILKPQLNSDT